MPPAKTYPRDENFKLVTPGRYETMSFIRFLEDNLGRTFSQSQLDVAWEKFKGKEPKDA